MNLHNKVVARLAQSDDSDVAETHLHLVHLVTYCQSFCKRPSLAMHLQRRLQHQIGDCNLFVQVQYKSSPIPKDVKWVLLMHGFPDTSDMWESQISALSAAGYAVAAPDMPGFGRSSFTKPQNVKQYSLRNIVLIMRGLLDHLGVQRAAVVGHDWGAAVAWSFALQCPDRLSHLVVLSVGHPGVIVVGGSVMR